MARVQSIQSGDGILATDSVGNIVYQIGTTVPTGAGYMVGAIFIDNNAAAGAQIWINEGTTASAAFQEVITEATAETKTGNITTTGTVTMTNTLTATSAASTFGDLIETDFNPLNRIWVRSDFTKTLNKFSILSASEPNSMYSFEADWIVSGSGAGNVLGFTGSARSDGAVFLNNSSASSAFVFMKPAKAGRLQKIHWSTSKAPRFRAVIKTGTSIVTNKFVMGLYSGSIKPARFVAGTNTANRVEVYLDVVADSNFHVNTVNSTVTSSSNSISLVVAASTVYDIEIRVSTARIVTILVNGDLLFTSGAALKAATRLVPIIGVQTEDDDSAVSAQGVFLYHTLLSQDITAT